jgi:hypothetical protein
VLYSPGRGAALSNPFTPCLTDATPGQSSPMITTSIASAHGHPPKDPPRPTIATLSKPVVSVLEFPRPHGILSLGEACLVEIP